jgi:hypothetical protein
MQEIAANHVEDDRGHAVSNVGVVIDGHTANVHSDFAIFDGLKRVLRSSQGIVDAQLRLLIARFGHGLLLGCARVRSPGARWRERHAWRVIENIASHPYAARWMRVPSHHGSDRTASRVLEQTDSHSIASLAQSSPALLNRQDADRALESRSWRCQSADFAALFNGSLEGAAAFESPGTDGDVLSFESPDAGFGDDSPESAERWLDLVDRLSLMYQPDPLNTTPTG